MKIVRPYGFSRTEREGKLFERRLVEASATEPRASRPIPEFVLQKTELVIGQWISLRQKSGGKRRHITKRMQHCGKPCLGMHP